MGVFIRKSLPLICLFVFKLSSGLRVIMGYAWVKGQDETLELCNCETASVLAGLALCHAQVTSCSVSPFFHRLSLFPPLRPSRFPSAAVPQRTWGQTDSGAQQGRRVSGVWLTDQWWAPREKVKGRGQRSSSHGEGERRAGKPETVGLANKGVKLKRISPPAWVMIGRFVTGTLVSAFKCSVNSR